jgi:hypothetical protein
MRLVTDEELREMGVVEANRLPKPIPIPADRAQLAATPADIKPQISTVVTVTSSNGIQLPNTSSSKNLIPKPAISGTGAFSPVSRTAFNHPSGTVTNTQGDEEVDPNMPVDVENCTPSGSPNHSSNGGRDENDSRGTSSSVNSNSSQSSINFNTNRSSTSSVSSTTSKKPTFTVEQNMLALVQPLSNLNVKPTGLVRPRVRFAEPLNYILKRPDSAFEAVTETTDENDDVVVVTIQNSPLTHEYDAETYADVDEEEFSTAVTCFSIEDAKSFFEDLVNSTNYNPIMEEIEIVLHPSQTILIPNLESFEEQRNEIQHVLQSAIEDGGKVIATYGEIFKTFKEYIESGKTSSCTFFEEDVLSFTEPVVIDLLSPPLYELDDNESSSSLINSEMHENEYTQFHDYQSSNEPVNEIIPASPEGEVIWLTESMQQIDPSQWHSE